MFFKKVDEKLKLFEHDILDFTQNISYLLLQYLKTEINDSAARGTEGILNMMPLLDVE